MDLRKGLAAVSSSLTSQNKPRTSALEASSAAPGAVYAQIGAYTNALFSLRSREEIAELTVNVVRNLFDAEHVEVVFSSEPPAVNAETGCSVAIRGSGGSIAHIQIHEKNDWSSFSSNDVAMLEAIAAPLGLRLENLRLEEELTRNQAGTVRALAAAIEVKDRYTSGHTKRVGLYADAMTEYLPISELEKEKIRLAGILHDIGKIGVPDRILLKPDKLTGAEWDEMRLHTEAGFDIVSQIAGLEEIAEILRHHHERWDGSGYPRGLREEEIPFASRVISVADTFDAIVTDRPYRKALAPAEARDIIVGLAGQHFDASVVAAFEQAFAELEAHVMQDRHEV